MTSPEKQLVDQIRELTRSGELERNPVVEEFAEQFAELCHEACGRLRRGAEFIEKGMRSEAVHEAETPPPLLELVALLRFDEMKRWRNICIDLELTSFPDIPTDTVARLREECERERVFSPLLKEYRRCVYQGDQTGCIRALRELREKDPDNPSWAENLRPLEEAQLDELLDQVDEALAARDLARLNELDLELRHAQRVVPVPSEVTDRVADALLAERREHVERAARKLVADLQAAVSDLAIGEVKTVLGEWDELVGDPAFRPDPARVGEVEKARAWLVEKQGGIEEQARQRERVADMWELINDPGASPKRVRREWAALQQGPGPVSGDLARRVEEVLESGRRRQGRRRKLLFAGVALLFVSGMGIAGVLVQRRRTEQRRRRVVSRLEELAQKRQFDELQTYLDAVRTRDGVLFQSPKVQHLQSTAAEALRLRSAQEKKFRGLLDRLKEIRRNGYELAEDELRGLVAEAREAAGTAEAERELAAWEDSWETWRELRWRRINGIVNQAVALANQHLLERERAPFTSPEAERMAVDTVRKSLAQAKEVLSEASSETVAAFNAVSIQIDAWDRDLASRIEKRQERTEKLTELRRSIRLTLPNIRQYGDSLNQFLAAFPDEPESEGYRKAVNHILDWSRAEVLAAFQLVSLPPDPRVVARIRKYVGDGGVLRGSVWEADLRPVLSFVETEETARAQLPMLILDDEDRLNLLVLHYRRRGTREWLPLYHSSPLASRTERDAKGAEYKVYWGRVYHAAAADQVPVQTDTTKVFPRELNSKDFEIRVSEKRQANIVPHGRFLYRLVSEGVDAPDLGAHVLKGIQDLLASEEIEPVSRAWVLKRLVSFLDDHYGDTIAETSRMKDLVDGLVTDVPWMNPKHPAVLAAVAANAAKLAAFGDPERAWQRLKANRGLLVATLSRKVRCIGSLQLDSEGELKPFLVAPASRNVWVLVANPSYGQTFFKVIGRGTGDDVILRDAAKADLFAGQLLMAPTDGRTCRGLLGGLIGATWRIEDFVRPASWPVNRWE